MTTDSAAEDARYVDLLMVPLRACANTRPSLGRADGEGVTLPQFHALYGADPLYHWIGLDLDLMYAAHKAAGAMTSIYRQLGFGCEQLIRAVVADHLRLGADELAWGYDVIGSDGKSSRHTLDVRIDVDAIRDSTARRNVRDWVRDAGVSLGLPEEKRAALRGAVFDVRQGYENADATRQNADMRSALLLQLTFASPRSILNHEGTKTRRQDK